MFRTFRMFAVPVLALAIAVPFFASTALAQSQSAVEAPPGVDAVREVDGEFRLHLSGEVEEGYSFYMEASFGSGGEFLCTTDAEMVEAGYQECVAGDMTMPFVAPEGEEVSYRILGNPGAELSQFVVSEGKVVISEGMVIEGSYAFPDAPVVEGQYEDAEAPPVIEAEPVSMTGTTQEAASDVTASDVTASDSTAPESSATETTDVSAEQIVEETTAPVGATPVEVAPDASDGFLPQSGGFPVLLVGGLVLLVAGGFLFKRMML